VKLLLKDLSKRSSSLVGAGWDERVAREVAKQGRIEDAFDRAESCHRAGVPEQALVSLEEAEALSGELPPVYGAMRSKLCRELAGRRAR
jgi:hypothetical protein